MKRKPNDEFDQALSASCPVGAASALTTSTTAIVGESAGPAAGHSDEDESARGELVTIYRVVDRRESVAPFGGRGSDTGGRWTSPGIPALYASFSPATALLEFVAHLEENASTNDLLLAAAQLSRQAIESPTAIPADWNERPYRENVRRIGDDWSRTARSLALRVPSALCPNQFNVILNPRHPHFASITVAHLLPLNLDPRLRF